MVLDSLSLDDWDEVDLADVFDDLGVVLWDGSQKKRSRELL